MNEPYLPERDRNGYQILISEFELPAATADEGEAWWAEQLTQKVCTRQTRETD